MIYRTLFLVSCITLLPACGTLFGDGDKTVRIVEKEKIVTDEVYTSKQRAHCEKDTGLSLDDTKARLEEEGIKVFGSSCGILKGPMPPSLCGESTLHINIHEVDERRIPEMEALGYKLLSSLEKRGYESITCD